MGGGSGSSLRLVPIEGCGGTIRATARSGLGSRTAGEYATFILLEMDTYRAGLVLGRYWLCFARVESPTTATSKRSTAALRRKPWRLLSPSESLPPWGLTLNPVDPLHHPMASWIPESSAGMFAAYIFCNQVAKSSLYWICTTVRDPSIRTQRAGRFSWGATILKGPSFGPNGAPSIVSATTTSESRKAGSSSAREKTTR